MAKKKKKKAKAVKKGLKRTPTKASKPVSLVKGKWIVCRGKGTLTPDGGFTEFPNGLETVFFDSMALASDKAPADAEVKKASEVFTDSFSLDEEDGHLVLSHSVRRKESACTLAQAIAKEREHQNRNRKNDVIELKNTLDVVKECKEQVTYCDKILAAIKAKKWTLEIGS